MGVAEPEGVKLPRNDDIVAKDAIDEEEVAPVTPGHSPPCSPVTIKPNVSVSKLAKEQMKEQTTKEDPPAMEGQAKTRSNSVSNAAAENPKQTQTETEKTSTVTPPGSPASVDKDMVDPSNQVGVISLEKAKEWAASELGIDMKRELPKGWTPGPNSVICGRGKECFER